MRLADDRRGRVPFALVGILLLVGSATVATTAVAPRHDPPAVDRAVREAAATTQPALRGAVGDAARAAAADPLLQFAPTRWGSELSDGSDSPFRAGLELRVYRHARQRLAAIDARAGRVRASAHLPPVETPEDAARALRRVDVAPSGPDNASLRVTVEGVRVVATRDGRTVGTRQVAPTVTVPSPVFALQERGKAFEERLNAGPLSKGLGRRLTVRLYGAAWARGHAQYRGAPVENVLANRHVEVATNGGALAVQRDALGASDPSAGGAHAWAAARAMTTDLLAGTGRDTRWAEAVLDAAEADSGLPTGTPSLPAPANASVTVRVNGSADRALAGLLESSGGDERPTLDAVVARNYAADARLLAERRVLSRTVDATDPPGDGWRPAERRVTRDRSVEPYAGAPSPAVPDGWRAFERYGRVVVETERTVRRWRRGNRTRTAERIVSRRVGVGLAVVARHAPDATVERRGTAPLYERGGPLDGPNLAGVPSAAVARLVDRRGGPDALARWVAAGRSAGTSVRLSGERPQELRGWLARDVVGLHREVRNVSVTLSRRAVGTYAVDPAARLAAGLRERRADLLDTAGAYDGAAGRARVAARAAYLDRVLADLQARSAGREARRARIDGELGENRTLADLRERMAVGTGGSPAVEPLSGSGTDGSLRLTVDTAPSYLTLGAVSRERLAARGSGETHPLSARNTNWVTAPYGDVADTLSAGLFGEERVPLALAARTLRASEGAAARNATVRGARADLRGEVVASTGHVRDRIRDVLAERGVGETASDRQGIVAAGLARWETPAGRALALTNGSAAPAIAAAAALESSVDRTRLTAELRTATGDALTTDGATVPESAVRGTSDATRAAAGAVAREAVARGGGWVVNRTTARALDRTVDRGFAGLPVAPVPGTWYATLNVWTVEVRGGYERVTLRSRRGGRDTVYTRDGSPVEFDVDGDGEDELLGHSTAVTFETGTTVVVVVPPGRLGVGDTDGNADERSPGYE